MSKLFTFSRSQTIIMVTMATVLILGATYLFIYLPNNKRRVEEQRFRCLQNIQVNIKAKRDNSVALLRSLLTTYILPDEYKRETLTEYISAYSRENFTLSQPIGGKKRGREARPIPKSSKNVMADLDAALPENVVIEFFNGNIIITLYKGGYSMGMKYSNEQFFGSLLPLDNFDQYLVMQDTTILLQTFESGITRVQPDSLPTRHGAFSREQVKDVVVGGTHYKLFAQEMDFGWKELKIIGLLKNQSYQDAKNELPGNVVIFLMIISIATILSLPWIKLYQIGGQDRLTAADGMLTFPIAMLFISVLFFVLFKYDGSFRPGKNASENMRIHLAIKLKQMFETEVETAYGTLTLLDALPQKTSNVLLNENVALPGHGRIKDDFEKWNIEEVFWMDTTGQAIRSWLKKPRNSPLGNFGNRDYVRKLVDKHPFYLKNDIGKPIYIEPVVSWTTGKFVSIISRRSGKDHISAVAVNLKCMQNPVTAAGTSLCIVDENGKVLYHSNASRNLNEDLLNELSAPDPLSSALTARTAVLFESKYRGRNYNIYAKPFDYLPYHVVVFEDRGLMDNKDLNVSYFCSMMLTGLFLTMIVVLLIVFLLSFHTSYFKKHYFDISWIGPDERFHDQYMLTFIWNVLNILTLMVLYNVLEFLEYMAILLVAVTSSVLFLNFQYQRFYKEKASDKAYLKRRVSRFLISLIVLINIGSFLGFPKTPRYLIAYELGAAVIWLLLYYGLREWALKKCKSIFPDFCSGFSAMVSSALIITSGIPVAMLFTTSYNEEIKLIARYRQKQFAEEVYRQNPRLDENKGPDSSLYKPITLPNVFSDRVWVNELSLVGQKYFSRDSVIFGNTSAMDSLYHDLAGERSDLEARLDEFYQPQTVGYQYFYDKRSGQSITFRKLQSGNYIRVTSAGLRHNSALNLKNNFKAGSIVWLISVAVLYLFFAILHRILRKLFAQDFPLQNRWEKVDEMIFIQPALNSLLFVLGAPGSGKMKLLKKMVGDGDILRLVEKPKPTGSGTSSQLAVQNVTPTEQTKKWVPGPGEEAKYNAVSITETDCELLDLFLIPDEITDESKKVWDTKVKKIKYSSKSLIVINHFEYDIKNPASNHLKLDLLEQLMLKKECKVIIVSTVHPMHFLDSLDSKLASDKADGASETMTQRERERWHVILGHFRIIVQPLELGDFNPDKKPSSGSHVLSEETNRAHFLVKMQRRIEAEFVKPPLTDADGSSLAAKVGISAHYFYTYIWQSLTKEEKFLLYDLAEDGLVNPYDDYNITILISKGLIIRKHGLLKLFNEGFRTFILTAIGNSEMMLIKNQIRDSGNWSKLKTPLIVIAVGVLIFLYASQNEAYSEIIKYVTLITFTVPTVYKIFGGLEAIFDTKNPAKPQKAT